MDRRIIEIIPLAVNGVPAFSSIVSKVYISRMVHNSNELIEGLLYRVVIRFGDERREIKHSFYFYSIVEFSFSPAAIGKPFQLKNHNFRQSVEIYLPLALTES